MDQTTLINVLMTHLVETTLERDAARIQNAKELAEIRSELAELKKKPDPKPRKVSARKRTQ